MAPNDCMLRVAPTVTITHPFLWAWDTILESFTGWKESNQLRAAELEAPEDAVYFDGERYVRFSEWDVDQDTRWRVQRAVDELKGATSAA